MMVSGQLHAVSQFWTLVAGPLPRRLGFDPRPYEICGKHTWNMKYEIIYQLDAIEYLFVYYQLDMFRAYTPVFRSNGCYSFFTHAAYGVLKAGLKNWYINE